MNCIFLVISGCIRDLCNPSKPNSSKYSQAPSLETPHQAVSSLAALSLWAVNVPISQVILFILNVLRAKAQREKLVRGSSKVIGSSELPHSRRHSPWNTSQATLSTNNGVCITSGPFSNQMCVVGYKSFCIRHLNERKLQIFYGIRFKKKRKKEKAFTGKLNPTEAS